MSSRSKVGDKQLTKRQRCEAMARKREERAVRAQNKKEKKSQSYLADDMNFVSFSQQLASMGLKLKDIPGDGNCLFRALGDQIDGHGMNHLKYREEVVKFMQQHRNDFEPFVEDDVPFERHVANLKKPGTYAGNDAIVAFAKIHKLTVVIHQLNSPLWQIHGSEEANPKQIHISYHNGDHYSSVRRANDMSATPTSIKLKADGTLDNGSIGNSNYSTSSSNKAYSNPYTNPSNLYSNSNGSYVMNSDAGAANYNLCMSDNGEFSWNQKCDADDYDVSGTVNQSSLDGIARVVRDEDSLIQQISHETGCGDYQLIAETLRDCMMDVGDTIQIILQIVATQYSPHNSYTGGHHMGSSHDSGIWSENGSGARIFGTSGAKPKKQKELQKQKKIEKKLRATERNKQRLLGKGGMQDSGYHENRDSSDDETVIVNSVGALTI